jgi:branched-chain amino acid transport system permease protein
MMTPKKPNLTTLIVFSVVALALILLPLVQSNWDFAGTFSFLTDFAIFVVIFAIITLGLNVQLGYAGISNFGVAGFFLLGSYVAAIFVLPPSTSPYLKYVGGFIRLLSPFPSLRTEEWLPFIVAAIAAAAACGMLAVVMSILTPRLQADYLAIATIGMAELLRALATVQDGLVNRDAGLFGIPSPLDGIVPRTEYSLFFLILSAAVLALLYIAAELAVRSPYGRVLRGIREDELATAAAGKNIFSFKLQSFVLGACITGVGAALYAWFSGGLSPSVFEPLQGTFIFWVMLIVGGIGSNLGAVGGAFVVWGFWVISLEVAAFPMPDVIAGRIPFIRLGLLGLMFVVVLLLKPQGLIPEQQRVSRWLGQLVSESSARAKTELAAQTTDSGSGPHRIVQDTPDRPDR